MNKKILTKLSAFVNSGKLKWGRIKYFNELFKDVPIFTSERNCQGEFEHSTHIFTN